MKHSGFTLIELLIVIAIIAVLAAILFPVFAAAKERARATTETTQAKEIGMSVKLYLNDYDDTMPIFYAYNSVPPAAQPGHKGIEVELLPYTNDKTIFRSPFDIGGPFTGQDVLGANSYWQAYGSSYRFTQCLYTVVSGESTQNNVPYTFDRIVKDTEMAFPSETRVMRVEMMPWFAAALDPGCANYGYDCAAPYNYFKKWSNLGGSLVFADSHARFVVNSGQFDNTRVDVEGHKSGEADSDPNAWSGTWYSVCD